MLVKQKAVDDIFKGYQDLALEQKLGANPGIAYLVEKGDITKEISMH